MASNRALVIYVHPRVLNAKVLQELRDAGHTVEPIPEPLQSADLILGPTSWRFNERLYYLIPQILKAGRAYRTEHEHSPTIRARKAKKEAAS